MIYSYYNNYISKAHFHMFDYIIIKKAQHSTFKINKINI